jgi:hypothetical protein
MYTPYKVTFQHVLTAEEIPSDPPKGRLYFVDNTSEILGDLGDGIEGWAEHLTINLNLIYSTECVVELTEGGGE